jgi:hypothetical protein
VDTSAIGGCLDPEFSKWSKLLFENFRSGSMTAVVSDLTRQELELAPAKVIEVLEGLPQTSIENVFLTEEARSLAENYIASDIVSSNYVIDAQHIAIATVGRVDLLVSWNFQHVVNIVRIRGFNSVNLRLGYRLLEIRSPREVVYEQGI